MNKYTTNEMSNGGGIHDYPQPLMNATLFSHVQQKERPSALMNGGNGYPQLHTALIVYYVRFVQFLRHSVLYNTGYFSFT